LIEPISTRGERLALQLEAEAEGEKKKERKRALQEQSRTYPSIPAGP